VAVHSAFADVLVRRVFPALGTATAASGGGVRVWGVPSPASRASRQSAAASCCHGLETRAYQQCYLGVLLLGCSLYYLYKRLGHSVHTNGHQCQRLQPK